MAADVITGLGGRADFVGTVPNADAAKLKLTDEEAAVFVQVGRASQIKDVLERSGLPEAKAIAVLLSLRAKGAIVPARVQAPVKTQVTDAASNETVDLPDDRKTEILEVERTLETKNLFELLGIAPDTSAADLRTAFYALSRKFHPDRFFGKNLGSFRGRIEKIFLKLSHANDVLSDEKKRAAYLKKHPELTVKKAVPAAAAPAPAPAPRTAADDQRDSERRSRLSRHPYLAKNFRVNELLARAKAQIANGQFGHAFTDLNMAAQMEPRNEEIKQLLNQTRGKNDAERSGLELKKGFELLEQQNPQGALTSFKSAASIGQHQNGLAAHEAAKLLWHGESNLKEATGYAQKAVDAEPKNASYHLFLGRMMEEGGHKALAKKHYEEAHRLDPDNLEAKKHVKGRWPF